MRGEGRPTGQCGLSNRQNTPDQQRRPHLIGRSELSRKHEKGENRPASVPNSGRTCQPALQRCDDRVEPTLYELESEIKLLPQTGWTSPPQLRHWDRYFYTLVWSWSMPTMFMTLKNRLFPDQMAYKTDNYDYRVLLEQQPFTTTCRRKAVSDVMRPNGTVVYNAEKNTNELPSSQNYRKFRNLPPNLNLLLHFVWCLIKCGKLGCARNIEMLSKVVNICVLFYSLTKTLTWKLRCYIIQVITFKSNSQLPFSHRRKKSIKLYEKYYEKHFHVRLIILKKIVMWKVIIS